MRWLLSSCLILLILISLPVPSWAERYFTWIDANGNVRKTLIESDEVEKGDQPASVPASDANEPKISPDSDGGASVVAHPKDSDSQPSETVTAESNPDNQIGQAAQRKRTANSSTETQKAEKTQADAEYNLDNYPDGNELEKRGFRRTEDGQPFFTWRDAEGRIHNSYYEYDAEGEPTNRSLAADQLSVSPARTISSSNSQLPAGADPSVIAVMGLDAQPSELQDMARNCCEQLPEDDVLELEADSAEGLYLAESENRLPFATGRSPYRLIDLAKIEADHLIRLRSFIKSGVFLPTAVFLDGQKKPIRIVTDLEFDFAPETLFGYGYLEARLSLSAKGEERYLLLLMRRADLNKTTYVASEGKIPHKLSGELEVTAIKAPR
ncbi:MalM family protein [Marinobacteraceae bacterium S3BR75-40.1]